MLSLLADLAVEPLSRAFRPALALPAPLPAFSPRSRLRNASATMLGDDPAVLLRNHAKRKRSTKADKGRRTQLQASRGV
jgi:hypothetical protein